MRKNRLGWVGLLGAILTLWAVAAPIREISGHQELLASARELVARYGPGQVLVTIDYDDTIAATQGYLGSEIWFDEQLRRLGTGDCHLQGVDSYLALVQLQNRLFRAFPTHLTEPGLPAVVREIQDLGAHVIVESSRNPSFMEIIESDLGRFGIDFSRTAIGSGAGYGDPYPLADAKGNVPGLSPDEVTQLLHGRTDNVAYRDGIYLTTGKHKGACLRSLCAKTGYTPKAILSVDDRLHHLEGIVAAFADRGVETVALRYTRDDAIRADYQRADVAQADSEINASGIRLRLPPPPACAVVLRSLVTPGTEARAEAISK